MHDMKCYHDCMMRSLIREMAVVLLVHHLDSQRDGDSSWFQPWAKIFLILLGIVGCPCSTGDVTKNLVSRIWTAAFLDSRGSIIFLTNEGYCQQFRDYSTDQVDVSSFDRILIECIGRFWLA